MKKVLKLSSLLAAVLLLAALAGVQLLSAQATQVEIDNAYVSNDKSTDADNVFRVTLTYDPDGDTDAWGDLRQYCDVVHHGQEQYDGECDEHLQVAGQRLHDT